MLVKFFYELKAEILHFEDFFDRGCYLELIQEIKLFSRLVVGKDLQDFWYFSKRFNVKITYFEEIEKVIEINQAHFVDPVEVAVYKQGTRVFIAYKVDDNRKSIPGDKVRVSKGAYEVFEELGFEVGKVLKENLDEDKKNLLEKLVRNNENAEYRWKFPFL